jgi:hypothetical protein
LRAGFFFAAVFFFATAIVHPSFRAGWLISSLSLHPLVAPHAPHQRCVPLRPMEKALHCSRTSLLRY